MVLDEGMRQRLHASLQRVLGDEEAAALMTELPRLEMASKADLDAFRTDVAAQFVDVRAEMRTGFADVRTEIADVRTEMAQMSARFSEDLRSAITGQTRQVFFGLTGVIASVAALTTALAHFH